MTFHRNFDFVNGAVEYSAILSSLFSLPIIDTWQMNKWFQYLEIGEVQSNCKRGEVFLLCLQFILSALLNGVGAALRIVSAISAVPGTYRYIILMAGQTLAGCAQPFILFAPTKLAAQWFSPGHRTFANMIGSTGTLQTYII